MIDINLVPPSMRKKSVTGVLSSLDLGFPQEIFWGIVMFCAGLLVFIHVFLLGAQAVNGMILAGHRAEWQKILPQKNAMDALGNEVKDLRKKMDDLTGVTSPKAMGWPRKLNAVSDTLSKGLWLRTMTLDGAGLTMEGSVLVRDRNEMMTVGNFVANLKKDEFFMRSFTGLEVVSVRRGKKGMTDVADFTVTAKPK
ncbi:MAG: PilN domain-containing protein [Candidatus Omnitrophica bacterium]|nr:PilN domain-containing protein [Candidatus Omnitrophota bacterium]